MPRNYRKLESSKDLTHLMTRYYATRKLVGKVKPLAWVTSGAPVEILIGMGANKKMIRTGPARSDVMPGATIFHLSSRLPR